MSLPVLLALSTTLVVWFTPLTVYLYWLVAVHRRDRPTVVAGHWDFVALGCGLGGFLLYAVAVLPAVVGQMNPFTGGGFGNFWKARLADHLTWLLTALGLLVLTAAVFGRTLRRRRRTLAVYNVEPTLLDAALAGVFVKLGLEAGRYGNLWSAGSGLVEAVPFHAFRHVTLKLLPPDPRLREEIEREVRIAVDACPPADNPAAGWLTTAAVAATTTVVGGVVLTFTVVFAR